MTAPIKKPQILWSEEEDTYLEKAWADGNSAREIAAKLGRTRNSVIGRVNRKGLTAKVRGSAYVPPIRTLLPTPNFSRPAPRLPAPKLVKPAPVPKVVPYNIAKLPPKNRNEVEPLLISIMNIRQKSQCAFPIESRDLETFYCGHVTSGHSYCPYHRSIMYMTPPPRRRSA